VLNFLIIAWVMFLVARLMNRLRRLETADPAAAPPPSRQEMLLTEIRDLLKRIGQIADRPLAADPN
jgi:large conductance mechanosensitive channel